MVETNEHSIALSHRFGQLVQVVVRPAEPARGKPETGTTALRKMAVTASTTSAWLALALVVTRPSSTAPGT